MRILLLLGLMGCAGAATSGSEPVGEVAENCGDWVDNDGDLAIDCDDPDCSQDPGCANDRPDFESRCDNGLDDDGGGAADCDDEDCTAFAICQEPGEAEDCTDGRDNDGDGRIDCDDSQCDAAPNCRESPPTEDCGNGVDDDADGDVDCADLDCAQADACAQTPSEDCLDGVDNDGDGAADCDDADCAGDPLCDPAEPEDCGDLVDNDGDGAADCDDLDCAADPFCAEDPREDCGDRIDNDGDGDADCEDEDCAMDPRCDVPPVEICDDGFDNDGDNAADCEDIDCADDPVCFQEEGQGTCGEPVAAEIGGNFGDTTNAPSILEPECTLGSDGREIVHSVTFDEATTVCATTEGSDFDTVLYVRSGCEQPGTEVACDDDGGEGTTSVVEFEAAADTEYFFIVDGYSSSHYGNYSLQLIAEACDAFLLADGCASPAVATVGTTSGQNTSSGAVHTSPECGGDGAEVVFSFSVDTNTSVCIDSNGSGYDTVLYVRTPACGGGAEVVCDDDGGDSLQSQVGFEAVAGEEYYVFLDAYSDGGGDDWVLNVALAPCE